MLKPRPIQLLILSFMISKLFFFSRHMVVLWDEAVYIGIGKSIFSLGRIGLFEPIRPIVLPLFLGIIWKINLDIILFGKILALLFSMAYLLLAYLLAEEVFDKKIALISCIILTITPAFFYNSTQIMTGIPSTVFALTAILLLLKGKSPWLIGFFLALSFLTRFPQGILLPVILLSVYLFKKKKVRIQNISRIAASFFITTLPYLIFNLFMYMNPFHPFMLALVHQGNPVHKIASRSISSKLHNLFYYIIEPIKDNPLFIFLVVGVFFIFMGKLKKDMKIRVILVSILFYLLYFTYTSNKQPRFFLVFLPLLAMISSFAVIELIGRIKRLKRKYIRILSFSIISFFLLFSSFSVVKEDIKLHNNWKVSEEPAIQEEFYKYFLEKEADCIFTTDPVPVAYSDRLFIPFYNSAFEANLLFDKLKDKCSYIIYTPDPFPCQYFDDICYEQKDELISKLNSSKELIFHRIYGGEEYNIYI